MANLGQGKTPFFLVAYGHVMRVSSRTHDEEKAVLETFGLKRIGKLDVLGKVTTMKLYGKQWNYRTAKGRKILLEELKGLHKIKTGETLSI